MQYRVGHVYLENRALVSCGSGLESQCEGGESGYRYVGVDLSWLLSQNCCAWGIGA